MFMVILNHIADRYVLFTKDTPFYEGIYLCEGISHCAVPIFLMLTGAFLIEKMPTISAKQFYINSFKKIGIPTIFFCFVYWIYDFQRGKYDLYELWITLKTGCRGYYAHWYVFMLIGIYALLPIISIIKQNMTAKNYERAVWIYFVWTIMSKWFETGEVAWSSGLVFPFLGFVLIGDLLKQKLNTKKSNLRAVCFWAIGVLLLAISYNKLYWHVLDKGIKGLYNVYWSGYAAPLVVTAAILIFCAFGSAEIKLNLSWLAALSFDIYLNHKLIITVLEESWFKELDLMYEGQLVVVFIQFVITFVISVPFAMITNKVFTIISRYKWR